MSLANRHILIGLAGLQDFLFARPVARLFGLLAAGFGARFTVFGLLAARLRCRLNAGFGTGLLARHLFATGALVLFIARLRCGFITCRLLTARLRRWLIAGLLVRPIGSVLRRAFVAGAFLFLSRLIIASWLLALLFLAGLFLPLLLLALLAGRLTWLLFLLRAVGLFLLVSRLLVGLVVLFFFGRQLRRLWFR